MKLIITKKYIIRGIEFPMNHSWALPDCVKLISSEIIETNEVEGTAIVEVKLEFCDQNCLENFNEIKLLVNEQSCPDVHETVFTINNPCRDLAFQDIGFPIKRLEDCDGCLLRFQAQTTNINSEWIWEVDENFLTIVEQTTDTVKLGFVSNQLPSDLTTVINLTVRSPEGCEIYASIDHEICVPQYPFLKK